MNGSLTLLVVVVLTAIAFDFTNGFHDTARFGEGVVSLGRLATARRDGRGAAAAPYATTVVLAGLVCVGALAAGFVAMTHK